MDKVPFSVCKRQSHGLDKGIIYLLTDQHQESSLSQLKYLRSYPSNASQPDSGFALQLLAWMQPLKV
jgi:ABC-type Fe3+ transport system substrate-binding protein